METLKVTSARQLNDKSIELSTRDSIAGTISKKRYTTIRGGISWPTARAPAYFCLVAQETVDKGRRVLLAEYKSESLSLSGFYNRITDIAVQMRCQDFYVEMPEDQLDCGYRNDFDDFATKRNSKVYLCDAYDVDNFLLGVSRIKEGLDNGGLFIPCDSIVFGQLKNLTRPDLENSPEETFYAINGLRHVIGSYHRDAPINLQHRKQPPPSNWRVM